MIDGVSRSRLEITINEHDMDYLLILGVTLFVAIAAITIYQLLRLRRRAISISGLVAEKKVAPEEDPYNDIDPLRSFDWKSEEPIQIRPFKPKYHLTMGMHRYGLIALKVNS